MKAKDNFSDKHLGQGHFLRQAFRPRTLFVTKGSSMNMLPLTDGQFLWQGAPKRAAQGVLTDNFCGETAPQGQFL